MALFSKDRTDKPRVAGYENVVSDTAGLAPETPTGDRSWSAGESLTGASKAYLGKGSRVTGKLSFEGPAQIDGHVDGEISAQDLLTVGEGAVVNADHWCVRDHSRPGYRRCDGPKAPRDSSPGGPDR